MTTSQKLWLGFGTLTTLLVLSSVAILVRIRSIEGQVGEMAHARDLSAVASQLEISTLGYALEVRAYLQTGDPKPRQNAAAEADKVEKHLNEYQRLARTGPQQEMAARFAPLWQDLKKAGQGLLETENRPLNLEDSKRFYELRTGLEALLDDEIQVEAIHNYNARKEAALQNVRAIVAFAWILLIAGALIALATSGAVGQAVVKGERVLAEQKERLRTTLASIGDAVITTDSEGRITNLNAVAEELTGWTGREAVGLPLHDVFHIVNESTRQPVESPAARALREGVVVGLANHTVLIAKDGTERAIDDSAAPIRCKEGKLVGCVLVFRDVTERRRVENALRRRESDLADFFDNASVGLHWVGPDGIILRVNQTELDLLGYSREEYVGHHIAEFHADPPVIEDILACLTRGDTLREYPARLRCKDGSIREVLINSNVLFEDGEFIHTRCFTRDITEKKRAEEALRHSEERLRVAQAVARVGSFDWNVETGLNVWTPELEAMYGLPPGGFSKSQQAWESLVYPEDRAAAVAAVERTLETGEAVEAEWRVVWPDGSVHWLAGRFRGFLNQAGKPVRLTGVNFDITDRKQAEERERQLLAETVAATAKFRAVFDQSSVFAGIMTLDGTVMEANRLCLEACGYRAEEVLGRPFWETGWWRHSPETQAKIRAGTTQAAAGVPYQEVLPYSWADGTQRVVEFALYPIRDDQGQVIFLHPTGIDITDRLQAEQRLKESNEQLKQALANLQATISQLRESEALFRTMGEAVPNFLWMTDSEGRPLYQNPAWQQYVGMKPEDLTASSWQVLHHQDDLPRLRQVWAEAVAKGEAYRVETRVRRHDGEYRWFAGRTVPLKNDAGRVIKWIGTMTDIHDLKQAEQALRDADRRKDEFLATLAHELRNPLAPIRNMLEIMKRADVNADLLEQARSIMDRQLSQLIVLIDDLLDVSRISRGKLELRKGRIELASIVHQAVEAACPLVERMGHELTVTLPPQPVHLDADPTRLAQVLGNLLNNACKFTKKGGHISLEVEVGSGSLQDFDEVVIRVRDSGIGIPADQLPRIFDMFTQLDVTLERSQSGLGIGLALVKSLVEMHGGTVEALSAGAGEGSEFVVRLPILPESSTPPSPPAPLAVPTTTRRILVVDDNRDSAESLAMLLSLTGNETHTAFDGLQAVEAAAKFRPDLMLLDIGLPNLNGYEACRRIREQPWGQSIVMVALTGWGQAEDRQKSKEAGFNAHLVKPVDPATLTKLLAEFPEGNGEDRVNPG